MKTNASRTSPTQDFLPPCSEAAPKTAPAENLEPSPYGESSKNLQKVLSGQDLQRSWNADVTGFTGGKWDVLHATDFRAPGSLANSLLRGINNTLGLGAALVNTVNNVGGLLLFDLPQAVDERLRSTLGVDFGDLAVIAQTGTPIPFDDLVFSSLAQVSEWSMRARLAVSPAELQLGSNGLAHITKRHLQGWPEVMPKSLFFRETPLEDLVEKAAKTPALPSRSHHLVRIVDAKRLIGIDRETTRPTSVYTVITDRQGSVFTMFPGRPSTMPSR